MQLQQRRVPSSLVRCPKGALVSTAEIQRVFPHYRSHMEIMARVARETKARSYNNHLFGASILAHNSCYDEVMLDKEQPVSERERHSGGEGIFAGGNVKHTCEAPKKCAEWSAWDEARESFPYYDTILAIVVIGPTKTDDHSGRRGETTLPCVPCCEYLASWVRPDTIVRSISSTTGRSEQHSWQEVLQSHEAAATQTK